MAAIADFMEWTRMIFPHDPEMRELFARGKCLLPGPDLRK
jgi:hypothetical protein